jgi:ferrous iron transport protein A
MKLSELKPGQEAIISEFENIFLEQIAPLGDPISVKISGYSLSLRLNEAEHISVILID